MRVTGSRTFLLIASVLLLSGCGKATSRVLPELPEYSDRFQQRAAEEMGETARPCDPIQPRGDCSATKRLVIDYGHLREEIRAVEE